MPEETGQGVRRGAYALAALAVLVWTGPGFSAQAQTQDLGFPEGMDIQYDSVRIEGTLFHLEGDVDILDADRGIRLLADRLSFDRESLTFEASGSVSFEQGELLLNGTTMNGDVDDGTVEMTDVIGVAPGPFYIKAKVLRQLEPGKFEGEGAVVTPCNQTTPIWEFRTGKMTFKPGSYVRMAWPRLQVKGVPILGLPYLWWPLQDSQRQTGFLMPEFGTSNRKGFMLSESFFWAIDRSADFTMTYERFGQAGSGFGGEFRHAFGEEANGYVRAYFLPGTVRTPEELAAGQLQFERGFSLSGEHIQHLPGQFTLRLAADHISSTQFAREFRDDVDRFLQRQSFVSAELTRSWGSSTLSIVGNSNERFNTNTSSTIGRKLPMARYNLRSTQVSGPVYFAMEGSAARLQKLQVSQTGGVVNASGGSYSRLDAFPEVSVQLTQIPWLTFNPFFRWRATYWSQQRDGASNDLVPQSVFRNFYEAGVEIVGPQLFKIIETPGSEYSPRLKHVIQPRVTYRRTRQIDADGLNRLILFDEIDFGVLDRQDVIAEVTTRLFAKRFPAPNAEERMVWQVAEVTVGHAFSLQPLTDEILEAAGAPRVRVPWFVRARINPSSSFYVQGDVGFTPTFTPGSYRLTAEGRGTTAGLRISWFRGVIDSLDALDLTRVLVRTSSNTMQLGGNIDLLSRRLSLNTRVDLDMFQDRLQAVTAAIQWNLQCCSIGVDVRRLNFLDREETQFSILLQLAQVGQFGFDNHNR